MNDNKKSRISSKRYVCIDLEMTEFTSGQRSFVPGCTGEVIQFGAVMLDENYNMISKFSSYVKPKFSSVTPKIQELTGITNENLENADDFITVFDKFSFWRGEGDITTFCWSKTDHKQLWNELEAKGKHRQDLTRTLRDFVDLQDIFVKLVSSRTLISLEAAIKLLQMEYEGQIHNAYSDSFNTARILHKIFCTSTLDMEFEYINPEIHKDKETKKDSNNYSCSFASFMSPELLAQFGISRIEEEADEIAYDTCDEDEIFEIPASSSLSAYMENAEISEIFSKYRINVNKWFKLANEVMNTEEMTVA